MKKLFFLLILLIFSSSGFRAGEIYYLQNGNEKKSADCINEYSKIVNYYENNYSAKQIYFKFATQKTEYGETGSKLTNELWLKGDKFKYANDFVTIYQDAVNQVLILRDSRKIIIKKADREEIKKNYSMTSKVLIDSLIKISTEISCTKNESSGFVLFKLPQHIGKKINSVKQAKIFYDPASGAMIKGEFEYFSEEGLKKDVIEYLKLSKDFDEKVLEGSAVSKVLTGKTLNNEYKRFELRDLRILPD